MAKKTAKKEESATPTKASAKDSAKTSKKAPAAVKAAAPKAGAVKTSVPKAAAPKAAAAAAKAPKAAKPKAAPIKLTDSQTEILKKVHGSGEAGYAAEKKIEERSLTALLERKLIKKGAKNKETGKVPHTVSAAGKKHIDSQGGSGS
jgi:hypothetical protein